MLVYKNVQCRLSYYSIQIQRMPGKAALVVAFQNGFFARGINDLELALMFQRPF